MKVSIVKGAKVDIGSVLKRSPVADIPDAQTILQGYLLSSIDIWVGYADSDVACVCGLIPPTFLSDKAYLWMLHTDVVEEHKFMFIRHSRIWIENLLEEYSAIYGHAEVGKDKTIRWLKWLGAEFYEAEGGRIPFMIKAKQWPIQ